MFSWSLALHCVAVILFILAAWPVPSRVNLIAAGLACWLLGDLIDTWP